MRFVYNSRLSLVIFAALALSVSSFARAEYTVVRHAGLEYGADPLSPLTVLDIYQPLELESAPVLFFAPGTGWTASEDDDIGIYQAFGNTFAGYYGLVTVVISYRAAPDYAFPTLVEDIADAFAFTLEHGEEYGADLSNVFLLGHSSGAHLSALMATDSTYLEERGHSLSDFEACIALSGLYNLTEVSTVYDDTLEQVFGSLESEVLLAASPSSYVRGGLGPFAVVYAQDEMPSVTSQSLHFASRLRLSRIQTELVYLQGMGHVSEIAEIRPDNPLSPAAVFIADYIDRHSSTYQSPAGRQERSRQFPTGPAAPEVPEH